jgi:hypothetical protein
MNKSGILKSIKENWEDWSWWRHVALPFIVRKTIVTPYYTNFSTNQGVKVMEKDWDNLILLDACRFDMFEEVYEGPGEMTQKLSAGSSTPDFLKTNFEGEELIDTVYVTGNPQVNVHTDSPFHTIINVWEEDWSDQLNTVTPSAMKEKTIEVANRYPNKRIISHFVQPHYPFIGDFGQSIMSHQAGLELSKRMANNQAAKSDYENVWLQLRKGKISFQDIKKAYYENLEITLPHVNDLLENLAGKTVVTSDHGNAYGERFGPTPFKVYGHPSQVYLKNLVEVPWLEYTSGERKNIISEKPQSDEEFSSKVASDRLKDLGYLP